jgi:hypothetical protein
VILWAATRNPVFVDEASDACGALGKNIESSETYGLIRAAELLEKHMTPQQQRDTITNIRQACVAGIFKTSTQGQPISPDQWSVSK